MFVCVQWESLPLFMARSCYSSRQMSSPEWYLQPGSWAEKTSLHHEGKKRTKKKNSMKTFVQDIWCKVTTVQWFHSWCFDCCKLFSSSSQHQPHAKKQNKNKNKTTRHKWGLVLKFDSVEMKSHLVQRVHEQKRKPCSGFFFVGGGVVGSAGFCHWAVRNNNQQAHHFDKKVTKRLKTGCSAW